MPSIRVLNEKVQGLRLKAAPPPHLIGRPEIDRPEPCFLWTANFVIARVCGMLFFFGSRVGRQLANVAFPWSASRETVVGEWRRLRPQSAPEKKNEQEETFSNFLFPTAVCQSASKSHRRRPTERGVCSIDREFKKW